MTKRPNGENAKTVISFAEESTIFKKVKMKMLTATALLMLTMKSVTGLRCYTCNSHFDPLCGDPFFDHLGEVPTIYDLFAMYM